MKIFKKVLVAMSCLLMMIGANINVFAAGTGDIIINAGDIDIDGKTFNAYKIMDVTVSGDNVAYTIADAFADFFSSKNVTTDDEAYNYLKDADVDTLRSDLSTYINDNTITEDGAATGTTDPTATISGLSYGYYLIIPSDATMQANLTTLKDTNQDVYIKGIDPTVDKKADNEDWTSAQIGDTVNFTVTSMVPDMTGQTEYYFKLTDTLSEGLTFNADSVVVKIGDTTLTKDTDYTVTPTTTADNKTEVTISFTNFISHAADAGKEITFEYSAVLNEKANVTDKESNSAQVQWSNDPDFSADAQGGTSDPDTTIIRTYQLKITKTDEKDNKLAGAHFEILRGADTTAIKLVQESAGDDTTAAVYHVATATEIADGTTIVTEVVSPKSGLIEIKGLDADTYQVKETKAPDGYNKAASQSATIIVTSTDEGETVTITGNDVKVINKAGVLLPETGSEGTVLFTLVGVALAGLVVGSFVISRRKEN